VPRGRKWFWPISTLFNVRPQFGRLQIYGRQSGVRSPIPGTVNRD